MLKKSTVTTAILIALYTFHAPGREISGERSTFPTPREVATFAEAKPHFGLRMGSADPTAGYGSAFEYGLEFAFQPYIPFGLGAEIAMYTAERRDSSDLNRSKVLAKGSYNLGGTTPVIRNSYLGVTAGLVVDTLQQTSYGRLGLGPMAGFDIPLNSDRRIEAAYMTLGANVSYLFVSNSAADDFGLNGQLKYWF